MKKLLIAVGAALGIYMIAKSLSAKKEGGYVGNWLAANDVGSGGGISSGGQATNSLADNGDWANNEKLPSETEEREILEDGGNETGGTGGSTENSVGDGL